MTDFTPNPAQSCEFMTTRGAFRAAVLSTVACAGTDNDLPLLQHVHMVLDPETETVVMRSTDRYMLAIETLSTVLRVEEGDDVQQREVLVNAKELKAVLSRVAPAAKPDSELVIQVKGNVLRLIGNGNAVMIALPTDLGHYPPLERLVPTELTEAPEAGFVLSPALLARVATAFKSRPGDEGMLFRYEKKGRILVTPTPGEAGQEVSDLRVVIMTRRGL